MHDLACVVHLHSLYSDGTGTVPEIARAAARNGLDVVLLTDHDTLEARRRGEEGWHGDVLVIAGHEVSPRGGDHLLAFGTPEVIPHRGRSPAEVCAAVHRAGGIGFAAHPFSRGSERFKRLGEGMPYSDLDCEALDGIELWSLANDEGERLPSLPATARFLAAPRRWLRKPPERNLREWDRLCASRRVVAIGGVDAHQFGRRVGRFVPLRVMSYRRSLALIHTHVLVEERPRRDLAHDRDQLLAALRQGRCYLALDWLAPARGFRFWAEHAGRRIEMGSQAEAGSWDLHVRLPLPARIRLLRDGDEETVIRAPVLAHRATGPGVWRVEAYRDAHGSERSWVISNPIYLR